ncbi:MAG TPA: pyruvate kinase [Fimbriimonadaceae bacterium]|nr:pyruvate kinase [Fimbriimonadaceae bacterium]
MRRRTKIVCTLGPAVDSKSKLKALVAAGMNVARINCSHGDWETRKKWISWIEELQPALSPIAVLIDLQGPKFRIGSVPGDRIEVKPGADLTVAQKGECTVTVQDKEIWSKMEPGDRLLLGDGDVELRLGEKKDGVFQCRSTSGGTVRSRQGVTLVGKSFSVPALTEKDREDLNEAIEVGADYIALSYVRRATDMRELRRLVDEHDPEIKLVAKIETKEGLKNIDEVIKSTDVVMVARGDLGLQMDFDEVPVAQKRIIDKCNANGTPVITATQMLESMLHSPRPTRAEASDVANAILDGTDAVMLSGETATGDYPVESVKTMGAIAEKIEGLIDHAARMSDGRHATRDHETDSVAHAAASIADALRAKAILTTSTSGTTPRLVSRYRPSMPVLCSCWKTRTQRQLAVVWGVESALVDLPETTDQAISSTVDAFLGYKRVKVGDKVVVTAGFPPGMPGNTNMLMVLDV